MTASPARCAEDSPPQPRVARAGRGVLVARAAPGGTTVLQRAEATSPLRFVRPTFPGSSASAVCLLTFGGGLVDGDVIDVDLDVGENATLVVFTQSTTKAFRGSTLQTIQARVAGTLVFLPDPVACFAGARYRQRVDVSLEGKGSAVLLDGFTSGRPAFGERWAFDALDLATTVRRDGRAVVHDATLLDASDAPIAPRMDGFEAMATAIAIGPRVASVVAAALQDAAVVGRDLVAAPSRLAQADGVIVRIAGTSPTSALTEARRRLRNLADIDVVDPFASRH